MTILDEHHRRLAAYAPDALYRSLVRGASAEAVRVLAFPGQRLDVPLRSGDVLIRIAIGEPGAGHLSVLVDGRLMTRDKVVARGGTLEADTPGLYATVVESGARPHAVEDGFARLVTNSLGIVPRGQMLVRLEPEATNGLELEESPSGRRRASPTPTPSPPAILKRYVSPSGNDTNDGSKSKPYQHIQHGLDRLRAEIAAGRAKQAALLVADGVYQEDLTVYSHIRLCRQDEQVPFTIDVTKDLPTTTVTGNVEIVRKTDGGTLVTIKDATDVTIRGIKLNGGTKGTGTLKQGGRGIVVRDSHDIRIEGCAIWNNWTTVVYHDKQAGTQTDPYLGESLVSDDSSGAGVWVTGSKDVTISGCFLNNNRCDQKWAVSSPFDVTKIKPGMKMDVSQQGETITFTGKCLRKWLVQNPEIYRNGGGAVYAVNSSPVTIEGNLLTNNQAGRGGAIRFGNKAYGSILSNRIATNEAWIDGGGIAVWDYDRTEPIKRQTVSIHWNHVRENRSTDDGGGVYLTAKTVAELRGNHIEKNVAGANGGGLRITFGSRVSVFDTVFRGNQANADAASLRPDNKDGGGGAAVQNSTVMFHKCTFEENEVLGFAGGGIYCNTVAYEGAREKLGEAFFGEGFDKILREKYKFTQARLDVVECQFIGNRCHGKTCYGKTADGFKYTVLPRAAEAGCEALLDAYAKYTQLKHCDASGGGMVSGTAGGAMYVLQKKDGLPLAVSVRDSSFKGDQSEHHEKDQRAAIFIRDCHEVELARTTVAIAAPTLYKLHLRDIVMVNANASGYVQCSGGKVTTTDKEVLLSGVTCR